MRLAKREGEVGGQPIPLYITNTDVASCLDILRLHVDLVLFEDVKEFEMEIKDIRMEGRVVAAGELRMND